MSCHLFVTFSVHVCIHLLDSMKMRLNMSSAKWQPFSPGGGGLSLSRTRTVFDSHSDLLSTCLSTQQHQEVSCIITNT